MSQIIKNQGKGCFLVYGDIMPIASVPTVPVGDAAPDQGTMDAATRKKLERVLELLEQFVLNSDVSDDESDPGRIWAAMLANKMQREEKAEQDRQAAQRAYMDRNPHKRREKGRRADWLNEEAVTDPARMMNDSVRRRMSICEEAEAAYAARNPHKRKK